MLIRSAIIIFVFAASVPALGGCAHFTSDAGAFTGFGMKDLENARTEGKVKILNLSYDDSFKIVTGILKKNGLKIYQSNKQKRYIVAMGFHKQVDTTRVGIFFDPLSESETKITLSSLSSTALAKAENALFGGLEK